MLFQRVKLQGMGGKEGEEVWKRVLNKEAWSCKVLLGKMLTFLQVKCLKELQSQAPRKRGHTPKNQHLSTQPGEHIRCREESQCKAFHPDLPAPQEGCRDCREEQVLLSLHSSTYLAIILSPGWGCSVQPCPDFEKAVPAFTSAGLAVLLLPCHGQWDDFQCRLEAFRGLPWLFLQGRS